MAIKTVKLLVVSALLLAAGVVPALAQQGGGGGGRPPMGPPLQLSSTGFADGSMVPEKYSCVPGMAGGPPDASKMTSPPLSWVNAPAGTKSFVLLLHDPDAHAGKTFDDITHWVVFNIPGDATSLPEGMKADSTVAPQGNNIARAPSFFGPCAPPGPVHHYTFELFALDTMLDLQKGASRDDVQKAMDGHVLTGTVLIGLFHRTAPAGGPPPPPPAK